MTIIVAPIDSDLDYVAETDPEALAALDIYAVLQDLPLFNDNVVFGYGIANTVQDVAFNYIQYVGGADGFDANAAADDATALSNDPKPSTNHPLGTLYNYAEVYLFDDASVYNFAQSLDFLNTVIGVGAGKLDAVIVQTGNGTGTDLTTPIVVTADEAADDTNVLAVTATSYYTGAGPDDAISAAPGADLALQVDDNAANIADELPTILKSLKGYTDFVRLRLDVEDTGKNIAANLLSIEQTLDTITSTTNAFFESNDTGNYDFVTVSLEPSDTDAFVPMTVAQYLPIRQDEAFNNIFYATGGTAPETIEINDTADDIASLPVGLFTSGDGNLGFYGSFITKIVATDGPLELSAALAAAIGDENISVTAPGGVSVVDFALGIGTQGGRRPRPGAARRRRLDWRQDPDLNGCHGLSRRGPSRH